MNIKKYYIDENEKYRFEFADFSVYEYHELAQETTILSDVDFVIDMEDKLLLVEYKNADVEGVVNTNRFLEKIKTQEFYAIIAKKYYNTLFLHWACERNKNEVPIEYVLLIEHPAIDGKFRKQLRGKIYKQLPFKLTTKPEIKKAIFTKFEVLNLEEWRQKFPIFKAIKI
ncbi:hypothetical protein G9F71_010355 [Clostridium sp. FP2]|uniref:hypothetical protein n=1 Tax=Clostridium sp. FP2 TaxID=2724481 RepID=UPI001CC91A69|nr:hypothetical protein [Clostridium sp. FP2]MBZ9623255.1 hypothetical protein [Clostridium sp. FP2]